jgi:serine/threonine protein kinase
MGEVYCARDGKLGREVALKILPEAFSDDRERMARFEREARLLAHLNHPNVAALHGLEEVNGARFLVMELVDGVTLAARILEGPIPVEEALPLFKQVAEALEAAHEKGIIHRDLKPSNMKITSEGKAKLLDFGLAKPLGGEFHGSVPTESPTVTREGTASGVILGTAAYMSPEQARGKSLDKRTDMWSFGCCLYEALAGKAVFLGETVSDTLARILEREPDWSALPSNTPAGVRRLLRRCLEKNPQHRIRDAADAILDLEEASGDATIPEARKSGPRREVVAWSALALTLVAAGVATWRSNVSPPDSREVTRFAIDSVHGVQTEIALSPDGRKLAYATEREGIRHLYLREMSSSQSVRMAGTEGASHPFFSPDGEWVGFIAGNVLKKASLQGGAPVSVTSAPGVGNGRGVPAWSPDGTIFFASQQIIYRISAAGGESGPVSTPDASKGERTHRWPSLLPGGKALLYTIGNSKIDSFDDASIAVLSLESGERKILIEGGSFPRFAASGHLLFVRAGEILAVPFDPKRLEVAGTPISVQQGTLTNFSSGEGTFAASENGTLAYLTGGSFGLPTRPAWVDRKGRTSPLPVGAHTERVRISPDGRLVALDIDGANANIWIYDLERGTLSRLTYEWTNTHPLWTPDGARVVYHSPRSERGDILFWRGVEGVGGEEQLYRSDQTLTPGSFLPDGSALAFRQSHPATGSDIWILSIEGDRTARPLLASSFNESTPEFSPDGKWLAYVSDETGRLEVYVQPYPSLDRRWPISTQGGDEPIWSRSGDELFYHNFEGGLMAVDIRRTPEFRPSSPRLLFEGLFHRGEGKSYDVAPDGKRFLMIPFDEPPPPARIEIALNWYEELERLVPTRN